jgi:hypothetical protein
MTPARSGPAWSAVSASHNYNDVRTGDIIEAFSTEKMAADLGQLTSAKA